MICPRCGSNQTQIVSEVNTRTDGGGFDVCEGLCCGSIGAVIFGPIGWLFALCGIGEQKTTTTTKALWVCGDCGNRWK